jgi:hypothetical protein
MRTWVLARIITCACLIVLCPSAPGRSGQRLRASERAAARQVLPSGTRLAPPLLTGRWAGALAARPTPVIAGVPDPPASGYLEGQGRYHSVLAPYAVRSHWPAAEVGGPDAGARTDRFTKVPSQRYIDVLVVPNPHQGDTKRAERTLWAFMSDTGEAATTHREGARAGAVAAHHRPNQPGHRPAPRGSSLPRPRLSG